MAVFDGDTPTNAGCGPVAVLHNLPAQDQAALERRLALVLLVADVWIFGYVV